MNIIFSIVIRYNIIRLTFLDFCHNHILQYINADNDFFLLSRSVSNFRIASFSETHTGMQIIQQIMVKRT